MRFMNGSVPVIVVAKVYGKDANWVRQGIVAGWLPIGVATKAGRKISDISELSKSGRTNFYISPKKLYDETGYLWRGERE